MSIWQTFNASVEGVAIPRNLSGLSREYLVDLHSSQFSIRAMQCSSEMLRLSHEIGGSDMSLADLLRGNRRPTYWGFALSEDKILMHADVSIDNLDNAASIIAEIRPEEKFQDITAEVSGSIENDRSSDELTLRRIHAALEIDLPRVVKKENGTFIVDVSHPGVNVSNQMVCRAIAGKTLELKGWISTSRVDNESACHYLLSRNNDVVGCRAAIDENGYPSIVSFVAFRSIEAGNLRRAVQLTTRGLVEMRHVSPLLDHDSLIQLYKHIIPHKERSSKRWKPHFDRSR